MTENTRSKCLHSNRLKLTKQKTPKLRAFPLAQLVTLLYNLGRQITLTSNKSLEREDSVEFIKVNFLRELNSYIAVKRISKGSKQGIKEYATEVKIISRLRHRNLVQLIGWYHEKKELLLVYEFMENGSLDFHLFKGKSLLTWGTRHKIAQGLALALLYLHEEWEQCVVHRDVKSSNVMLDSNFNAKLGDFGLARFVDHEKGSQTTMVAGTMGYLAPECVVTGKASKESDVYSFGVVALEIACGRKPFHFKVPKCQMGMVEWVWDLYGMGRLLEAADPKLGPDLDEREMEQLMIVGLWCAHPDHNFRPKIRHAIHVLNFEAPLPNLPQKQPTLSFSPSPLNNITTSSGTSQNQQLHLEHIFFQVRLVFYCIIPDTGVSQEVGRMRKSYWKWVLWSSK